MNTKIRNLATVAKSAFNRWQAPILLLSLATLPFQASAAITFQFTYTDPTGVGFNDATQGAARKASLEQTATLAASYFPGYTATIQMSVNGAETTDGVLAAAGSNPSPTCVNGFGGRGIVGTKVLGGADANGATVDGTVTVNFEDQTWGLGDTISGADFDFKSTMLHELLHAMGFSHSVNQNGSSACSEPAGTPGSWSPYDQFLGDITGFIINQTTFALDGTRWGNVVIGGAGTAGVVWQGPQGKSGNSGQPVPLFSPTTYSGGSSISHLDDDFFTSQALLMEAATVRGPGTRTLSTIEVGMLKDIGFANVTATPTSATFFFRNGFED